MGWYNSHPSDLNNLPDLQASIRYVDLMGGADNVITKAKTAFDRGEYRWVAELLKHVVFAYEAKQLNYDANYDYCNSCNETSTDTDAKLLLADTLEQLGYQAESGPWRSEYLQGAAELRAMVINPSADKPNALETATPDVIEKMSIDKLLDFLAIQLDADFANDKSMRIRFGFSGINKDEEECNVNISSYDGNYNDQGECDYDVTLNNSVLNYTFDTSTAVSNNNIYIYMKKSTLSNIATGNNKSDPIDYVANKSLVDQSGDDDNFIYINNSYQLADFNDFLNSLDISISDTDKSKNFWFNIITPNEPFDLITQ